MSKEWWKAAGIRALKTFCQGAVTLIGTNLVSITEIDWLTVLGVSTTMAVVSLLTSVAGLPELKEEEDEQ